VTCIWDRRDHADTTIDAVQATHTHLLTAGGLKPSPRYLPPERYLAERHDTPMRSAPALVDQDVILRDVDDLSALRSIMVPGPSDTGSQSKRQKTSSWR
jgi:hypothetical protein